MAAAAKDGCGAGTPVFLSPPRWPPHLTRAGATPRPWEGVGEIFGPEECRNPRSALRVCVCRERERKRLAGRFNSFLVVCSARNRLPISSREESGIAREEFYHVKNFLSFKFLCKLQQRVNSVDKEFIIIFELLNPDRKNNMHNISASSSALNLSKLKIKWEKIVRLTFVP